MNKFTVGAFGLGLMAAAFFYTVGSQAFDNPRFTFNTRVTITKGFFRNCTGTVREFSKSFKSYEVLLDSCNYQVVRITEEFLE